MKLEELQQEIKSLIASVDWSTQQPFSLFEPIQYILQSGGKRLRPMLVLLAARLYSDDEDVFRNAINAALAIEFFHNFTLMHDDVMDNAGLRRGKPTVYLQYGENAAILSGDQLLIEAYKQLASLPEQQLKIVLPMFNQMATDICCGQQYDMEFEKRKDVTIDEYLNMIKLKTSVLLGYALKIGAYLANAPLKDQELLFDYGVNIGLAFQLQDDWLDVYGNTDKFGKLIGGDIICNKKTFLLITALRNADEMQHTKLIGLLENNIPCSPEDKIKAVTDIYDALNINSLTSKAIIEFTDKAKTSVETLSIHTDKKQALVSFAENLIGRNN